jgi:MFS superfamily sulfate permease-like transporter
VVIERTLTELSRAHPPTAVLSGCVLVLVLGGRRAAPKLPWGLVAVIGAVLAAQWVDLAGRGVAVLGPVAAGLPSPRLPWPALADVRAVLPVAASMVVVILAQSAATARAYATRFGEHVDTDADLVALGGANLAAAATGTFVVNGSPTKTQMVVDGGGRSQRAQLAAAAAALLTCLLLTAPLARLPLAALAGVVFVIGVELVDVAGLRRILAVRREEFVVALLTTASVVVLGVELGIAVAVVISMVDHLRHSYTPPSGVLVKSADGHWRSVPVTTGARTEGGLLIYRFASGLYFANAARLAEDVDRLVGGGPPLRWFCLDAAAVGDIDYSASEVLHTVAERLRGQGVRLVLSNVLDDVHRQLERYGLVELIGPEAFYETSGAVLDDFRRPRGPDQG